MRGLFIALVFVTAVPAFGQVQSRPTDPPIVTAENESWVSPCRNLSYSA